MAVDCPVRTERGCTKPSSSSGTPRSPATQSVAAWLEDTARRPREAVLFAQVSLRDIPLAWTLAHTLSLDDDHAWSDLAKVYERPDHAAVLPAARRLRRMRTLAAGSGMAARSTRSSPTSGRGTGVARGCSWNSTGPGCREATYSWGEVERRSRFVAGTGNEESFVVSTGNDNDLASMIGVVYSPQPSGGSKKDADEFEPRSGQGVSGDAVVVTDPSRLPVLLFSPRVFRRSIWRAHRG